MQPQHEREPERGRANLTALRFSLALKVIIVIGAFYASLQTGDMVTSIFYLVVSILFAGLFLFQLDYYRKQKTGQDNRPD